jgi:hypothetical protein
MTTHETRRTIRAILAVLVLAATAAPAATGPASLQRALDQTINEVAREAAQKLKATDFPDITTIAVLPLWGDCRAETKAYIVNMIQSQIIGGRYRVLERDAKIWDALLEEIAWNTRREDVMTAETVQKFGKVAGCDAIVFGTVRECAFYLDSGRAITRLTLKMSVVQTGEARWSSGEIKSARLPNMPPRPRPDLDPAMLRAISQLAEQAVAGLKGRNVNTTNFCVFPLLGHEQGPYVTEVLQAELTKAGCSPVPVSRAEWDEFLAVNSRGRESLDTMADFAKRRGYDAFLYGTVSECRTLERKYKALARATLTLVNAQTGEALWSPGEIRGQVWLDWQDVLGLAVGDPIVWVLGGILVLLILWRAFARLFKSATRPR